MAKGCVISRPGVVMTLLLMLVTVLLALVAGCAKEDIVGSSQVVDPGKTAATQPAEQRPLTYVEGPRIVRDTASRPEAAPPQPPQLSRTDEDVARLRNAEASTAQAAGAATEQSRQARRLADSAEACRHAAAAAAQEGRDEQATRQAHQAAAHATAAGAAAQRAAAEAASAASVSDAASRQAAQSEDPAGELARLAGRCSDAQRQAVASAELAAQQAGRADTEARLADAAARQAGKFARLRELTVMAKSLADQSTTVAQAVEDAAERARKLVASAQLSGNPAAQLTAVREAISGAKVALDQAMQTAARAGGNAAEAARIASLVQGDSGLSDAAINVRNEAARHAELADAMARKAKTAFERADRELAALQAAVQQQATAVKPEDIPKLPPPPPATQRSQPTGADMPTRPAKLQIVGQWRQVDNDSSADFLPGGYASSVLTFTSDGIVQIRRAFGADNAIAQVWRVGYQWDSTKSELTLGRDPNARPSEEAIRAFAAAGLGLPISAPTQSFPVSLLCRRMDDRTIRIGPKMYNRVGN